MNLQREAYLEAWESICLAEPLDTKTSAHHWDELVDGRWSIVKAATSPGRHCLLAQSSKGDGDRGALREREHLAASLAASGASNKTVGFELRVASSTAAGLVGSALRKLGLSRQELVRMFAPSCEVRPGGARLGAPPGLRVRQFSVGTQPFIMFDLALPAAAPLPERARDLTVTEVHVVRLALEGLSNSQIAERRGTSVHTVANQLSSIFRKLQAGSRNDLWIKLAG